MIRFLTEAISYFPDTSNDFLRWFYDPYFIGSVKKYAVCILLGIILAYLICTVEGERMGIDKDKVLSCATVIVPLCILGARLWYLIGDGENAFIRYQGENFFKTLLNVLAMFIGFDPETGIYEGIAGLAIHGGIAVAILGTLVASKVCKWDFLKVSDMLAPGLLIGQICGRWGNFFNQEAHGIVVGGWTERATATGIEFVPNITDVSAQYDLITKKWLVPDFIARNFYLSSFESYDYGVSNGSMMRVSIASDAISEMGSYCFYYPTFYFEMMLNLVGLILYFILRRQKWVKSGAFFPLYLIWYGVVRYFIEIIRTDSLYLPGTTIKSAQITSILMAILGVFVLIYIRFIKKRPSYMSCINLADKEKRRKK